MVVLINFYASNDSEGLGGMGGKLDLGYQPPVHNDLGRGCNDVSDEYIVMLICR